MSKFRIPEILLGAMLAIAVFAMGMVFDLSQLYQIPSHVQSTHLLDRAAAKGTTEAKVALYTLWLALSTGALVIVSSVQIGFLIRADRFARIAASAAQQSAESANLSAKA